MEEALRREIQQRQARCQHATAERGLDALLVVGTAPARAGDLLYLANFMPGMPGHITRFQFRGRGYGMLLLPVDRPPILCAATGFLGPEVAVEDRRIDANLPRAVAQAIASEKLTRGTIGLVGTDVISLSLYQDLVRELPGVHFTPADDIVMNMRTVKSPYEIAQLRQGAAIADEVAHLLQNYVTPGRTELEIASFIIRELSQRGINRAFATCQSGVARSGEPFTDPVATDRVLEAGDMVHMEINGRWNGYMIDICRSTVAGGPSSEQSDFLDVILRMLEDTVDAARDGIPAEQLEQLAAKIAGEAGLAQHFSLAYGGPATYLGHSIGLGNDEPPLLMAGDKTLLRTGMVITFEPGLYRTAMGGARIEDEILILEDGAESLNTSSRKWW